MQKQNFECVLRLTRRISVATISVLSLTVLLASSLELHCAAQNSPGSQHGGFNSLPQPTGLPVNGSDLPGGSSAQNDRLLKALNADRQKAMVSDTNKLLRLVNELNAEIGSTRPDEFTPAELRKLAEIEKLAHSVKDKMSTSVRGTPAFQPTFQPVHY